MQTKTKWTFAVRVISQLEEKHGSDTEIQIRYLLF